ncbi:hypothetical protein F5144DRAFT_475446, partial [Chaetomium tenue]
MALVYSAPNLTELYLVVGHNWGHTNNLFLNKRAKGRISTPKFTLPFLTTVVVDYSGPGGYPACFIPSLDGLLHSAPNLTTLRLNCRYKGGQVTASLPQLTTLDLCRTSVSTRNLRKLVRHSARLVEFRLTHWGSRGRRRGMPPVSPQQALHALAPARLTLRRLTLHTWMPEDDWWGLKAGERFPLLDGVRLADLFPALEQLSLDVRAVAGLPDLLAGLELLEELTLVKAKASHYWEIATFIQRVRVCEWQRLRRVKM